MKFHLLRKYLRYARAFGAKVIMRRKHLQTHAELETAEENYSGHRSRCQAWREMLNIAEAAAAEAFQKTDDAKNHARRGWNYYYENVDDFEQEIVNHKNKIYDVCDLFGGTCLFCLN